MEEKSSIFIESPDMEIEIPKCSIHYCISTPIQDREGDIILPNAFDLTQHQRNPIGLFDHDMDIPIGKWSFTDDKNQEVYTIGYNKQGNLEGTLYYNQSDYNAMSLFDLAVKGICRAVSPGFITKKFKPNENTQRGRIISLAELIEVSPCVVGENPDALMLWVEKSFKGVANKLHPKILTQLRALAPEKKAQMIVTTKAISKEKGDVPPGEPAKGGNSLPGGTSNNNDQLASTHDADPRLDLKEGQKAIDNWHSAAHAMKAMLSSHKSEHPDVMALSQELGEVLDSVIGRCEEVYQKAYPGDDEDSKTEMQQNQETVKSFKFHPISLEDIKKMKELQRGLDDALAHNKRMELQIKNLKDKIDKKNWRDRV